MSKIIAVNAGSSSLKFKLYEMPEERVVCSGIADRIGHEDGIFIIKKGSEKFEKICPLPDHSVAVQMLLDALIERGIVENLEEIKGIGNRIVQGGAYFSHSEELTPDVEAKIESLIPLAPLHNGAHLICFRAFKKVLPNVRHVAVFDTAFHQTMAPEDYMYACPYEYYTDYKVRRYGAHGTSHLYLLARGEKIPRTRQKQDHFLPHRIGQFPVCDRKRQMRDDLDGSDAARGRHDGNPHRRHRSFRDAVHRRPDRERRRRHLRRIQSPLRVIGHFRRQQRHPEYRSGGQRRKSESHSGRGNVCPEDCRLHRPVLRPSRRMRPDSPSPPESEKIPLTSGRRFWKNARTRSAFASTKKPTRRKYREKRV